MFNFINTLPIALLFLFISTLIISKSADKLGDELSFAGYKLNLPSSVKGATLDGISSSFPEFCTAVVAVVFCNKVGADSSTFADIGVATICGSGIFNIIVIPMLSIIAYKGTTMNVDKKVIFRDIGFYFVTIAILIGSFFVGVLNWITSLLLILTYVLYCFVMYKQTKNFIGYEGEELEEANEAKKESWTKIILISLINIIVIYLAVECAVQSATIVGKVLNIPMFVMSVIVLAAVTSIPDTILSIKSAKNGDAESACANAVGSNIFDLAICVGVPLLTAGTQVVNFGTNAGVFGFLLISAVVTAGVLLAGATKKMAVFMFLTYISFILYICSILT